MCLVRADSLRRRPRTLTPRVPQATSPTHVTSRNVPPLRPLLPYASPYHTNKRPCQGPARSSPAVKLWWSNFGSVRVHRFLRRTFRFCSPCATPRSRGSGQCPPRPRPPSLPRENGGSAPGLRAANSPPRYMPLRTRFSCAQSLNGGRTRRPPRPPPLALSGRARPAAGWGWSCNRGRSSATRARARRCTRAPPPPPAAAPPRSLCGRRP